MINTGMTNDQAMQFYSMLKDHHKVTTTMQILGNDLLFKRDISDRLMSGTSDLDATADITRSVKCVIADADKSINLDAVTPQGGLSFYGNMIRIYQTRSYIDYPTIQYTHPIFTGPIVDLNRDGVKLELVLQGKEVMAKGGQFRGVTWPAGCVKVDVIVQCLREYAGEIWFDFDTSNRVTFAEPWSIEPGEDLWARLQGVAESIGMQLFYNAYGICCLRYRQYTPVWTFDDTYLTSIPEVTFDMGSVKNAVHVVGGTPEGRQGAYSFDVTTPPTHPLSPQTLAVNGVPRYLTDFINDNSLTSLAEVQNAAWQRLSERMLQAADVTFTSVTVPHMEEGDVYMINSKYYYGPSRLAKQTIDLVGSGEMSVGFLSTRSLGGGQSPIGVGEIGQLPFKKVSGAIKHPLASGLNGGMVFTKGKKKRNNKNKNKGSKGKGGK